MAIEHTSKDIKEYLTRIRNHPMIKAINEDTACVFIGAGLSKNYGLPNWPEFANSYLNFVITTMNKKAIKNINHRTKEKLYNPSVLSDLEKLSICEMLCKKYNLKEERVNFLKKLFKKETYLSEQDSHDNNGNLVKTLKETLDDVSDKNNVYKILWDLNVIYITTNYDNLMDYYVKGYSHEIEYTEESTQSEIIKYKIYDDKDIYNKGKKLVGLLKPGDIVHIHGCIQNDTECSDLIISREDYMRRYYGDKNSKHKDLLKEIFKNYTVIFLGYSLKEKEILQFMFEDTEDIDNKRYFVLGCYPDEYEYINIYQNSLEKYSVEIFPYDITKEGHSELVYLLEELCKQRIKDSEVLNLIYNGDW